MELLFVERFWVNLGLLISRIKHLNLQVKLSHCCLFTSFININVFLFAGKSGNISFTPWRLVGKC
jgi:hypothetical protein